MVVVSVTTLSRPEEQDMSCVLKEGDHPFIRHDSVIPFGDAVALRAADILRKQYGGAFAPKPELPPAVFERVMAAAKASRDMSPRIKSIQRADKLCLEAC